MDLLNEDIRVDLHIHSVASSYKEAEDSSGTNIVAESDAAHLDVLFKRLSLPENKINLISITDHNRFDPGIYREINRCIDAGASGSVKAALPGIEFDVEFQVGHPHAHVITIFDASEWNGDSAEWEDDYARIHAVVERHKITDAKGKYSMDEFELILKEIGMNVILIAHQHQSLTSPNVKKRSISCATDDAVELVKYGYIDALEYTKSRIQGIVLSDLVDLSATASTIVGSDCHTWAVYPKHDRDANPRDSHFSTIRALPTFKGLLMALTSSSTRFQQPPRRPKDIYLKSVLINGIAVELCPGINVIVGENGVGKSSLLATMTTPASRLPKHVRALKEANGIQVSHILSGDRVVPIAQNELEQRFQKSGGMFEDAKYPSVDNSLFERRMREWSSAVKERIKRNIRTADIGKRLSGTSFKFDFDLEADTYYTRVVEPDGFTDVENPHEKHLGMINEAIDILNAEHSSGYYKEGTSERSGLEAALSALKHLSSQLAEKSQAVKSISETRNAISLAIARYGCVLDSLETDADRKKRNYRDSQNVVRNVVLEAVKDACRDEVTIPECSSVPDGTGTAENSSQGFKFVSTAAYADTSNLSEVFLTQHMNAGYKSVDDILNVQSSEDMERAVPARKPGTWDSRWDAAVESFISNSEAISRFIKSNSDKRVGNTLGEQSLTYYEYCSYRGTGVDVFVIDQPEDHISNARIAEQLVAFFDRMRKDKQIILVTHNPLLVVNQDVDNVICLDEQDGKIMVTSGCLEYDGILETIANKMDGGTEAIKRRLRAYGETV